MFFENRIKSIKKGDRVLEIGPGSTPSKYSSIFLELSYSAEEDMAFQFGNSSKLVTNKQIVYYNGGKFPFSDKEFDYVICSHVLEHVADVNSFLHEIFRVGKKGYLEYPLIYYDYLYNIPAHLNFLHFDQGEMLWMKKSETSLSDFSTVQDFFRQSLTRNYNFINNSMIDFLIQGFEWDGAFDIRKVDSISNLMLGYKKINTDFNMSSFLVKQLTLKEITTIVFRKFLMRFKRQLFLFIC